MMTAILWIKANWDNVLAVYGGVVALCTTIVKMTKTPKDDAVMAKVLKIADFFSTAFLKSDIVKIRKGAEKLAEEAEEAEKLKK